MTDNRVKTNNRLRVLQHLEQFGPKSCSALRVELGIETDTLTSILFKCSVDGEVRKIAEKRGSAYERIVEPDPVLLSQGSGSGIIAPITFRQQLARDILAQHEAERADHGPRRPGRGRPVSAKGAG